MAIDWTKSMRQTFEFYTVDPIAWTDDKLLTTVKSCSISWDSTAETLGSASLEVTDSMDECYVRVYLVATQDKYTERFPLGTFLVQSPSVDFDGKVNSIKMDGYTPLIELKENYVPFGYTIESDVPGQNVMNLAYNLTTEHARAPVVKTGSSNKLLSDFVANADDTWLTFLSDLIANLGYRFDLNARGDILFSPIQDTASLTPVWTYTDDNSSILYPEITLEQDIYDIPNVVEAIYTTGVRSFKSVIENNDKNSITSTVKRGRKITMRDTNPSISVPEKASDSLIQSRLDIYAKQLLRNASCVEYSISYKHGYCPVRIGDAVRLNYERAGIINTKAKVVEQSIECKSGCSVSEKAIFTKNLWG